MDMQSHWRSAFYNLNPPTSDDASPSTRRLISLSKYCTFLALLLDCSSIAAGLILGLVIYDLAGGFHLSNIGLKLFAFGSQYAIAFFLFGRIHSLYSQDHSLLQVRATAGILRVSTFSLLLLSVESFFTQMIVPRLLLVVSWGFITILVLLQKSITRPYLARLTASSAADRRVLIVGTGAEARRLFSFLLNSPDLQLTPVAFLEESGATEPRVVYSHDYRFRDCAPVYSGHLDADLLAQLDISEIYIVDPDLSSEKINEIAALSTRHSIELSFVASAQPRRSVHPMSFRMMDGILVSSLNRSGDLHSGYEPIKRVFDFGIALCLLLVSLPVWLIAAALVRFTSEGPIFFRQERIGHHGRPFTILKFRSMYVTAPTYGRSPEDTRDPRITPAGQFLRKTSLDELPQLINVLRGDMSLVGPRPEMTYVVDKYTPDQRQRLSVPQGITGIWQLSADRKFAIHKSLEYDLYYIENRGLFLDLAILLHTAVFAMKGI